MADETPSTLPAGTAEVLKYAKQNRAMFEAIYSMVEADEAGDHERRLDPSYREALRARYSAYASENVINQGDFVEWIPGLKNRRKPDYGEPVIVVEVRTNPTFAEDRDPNSAYYREKLDLVLGLLDEDDEFIVFHFDSSRFRAFVPKDETDDPDLR